MKIKIFQF